MAVNVTRDYLLENGYSAEELDRLLDLPAINRPRVAVPTVPGQPTLVRADRGDGWWEGCWDDWKPSSKNLKTSRWAWARARKVDDAAVALWRFAPDGPREATGRRRVSCRIDVKRASGRQVDPQNCEESLFDSLTNNGILVDDSARWLERTITDLQIDRNLPCAVRTIIRVEEK